MWNTFIIKPMVNVLLWIYGALGLNFGLAIIIFTILIKLLTYPLTAQQLKSSQAMQELQKSKKWQDIQKKYKNDREKLAQEQMKIYQEMGIQPLASCLPLLIQLPILFGLYRAIYSTLAFTPIQLLNLSTQVYPSINASTLVPLNSRFLWMDLSQPDLIQIPGISIPLIGGIPILAILVIITTFVQQKLVTPPSQPGDQSAQMAQSMNMMMPLMVGFFALTFPSGLALYWVASNLLTIVQYAAMGRTNWRNLLPVGKHAK